MTTAQVGTASPGLAMAGSGAAGAPPSSMVWAWPGFGQRAATGGGGRPLLVTGATPEVPGALGTATRVEVGATNVIANPAPGSGTGYSASGSATISYVDLGAEGITTAGLPPGHNGKAIKVVLPSTAGYHGAYYAAGALGTATAYVSSVYAYCASAITLLSELTDHVDQGLGASTVLTAGTWTRATTAGTTDAHATRYTEYTVQNPTGQTFYLCALQVETGSVAGSYCDGMLGAGYAWTGTAHASTSTRATGRLQASACGCSAASGALALWWRPDASATYASDRTLLRWGSGTAYLDVTYRASSDKFEFTRQAAGGSADVVQSAVQAFAAGDSVAVVASWDQRGMALSVGGITPVRLARTAPIPVIADTVLDVASSGAGAYARGGLGPVVWYSRALLTPEVTVLSRMARAPRWQEVA